MQEIPLSEVLQVRGPARLSVPSLPGTDSHSFELVTASLVFCVQAGDEGAAWESSIYQALMPLQSSTGQAEQQQGESAGKFPSAPRTVVPFYKSAMLLVTDRDLQRDNVVSISLNLRRIFPITPELNAVFMCFRTSAQCTRSLRMKSSGRGSLEWCTKVRRKEVFDVLLSHFYCRRCLGGV